MSHRLLLSPVAESDAEAIFDYLYQHNPNAALRFVDSLKATTEAIQRLPQAGMHLLIEVPNLVGVLWRRVESFPNHLVFYRFNTDLVEVLRVLHSAQDWASQLEP